MNRIFLFSFLALLLVSCNSKQKNAEIIDIQHSGDTIYVSENSVLKSKIRVENIVQEMFQAELTVSGTVKAIPSQFAEIAPPFEGRIVKSFVRLGQKVGVGSPLFEINSTAYSEVLKNYFQAKQNKIQAERNFQRQQKLVEHGVGAQKDLEEAEANQELMRKEYENSVSELKTFGVDSEQAAMGQAFKLCSPVAGEVVQYSAVIGQFVKDGSAPLAIVAELSTVWVVAQVKERYIGDIHTNDEVEVRTDAMPDSVLVSGHVYHIGELLDEDTRSVQVIIACNNKDRILKPGMFSTIRFIHAASPSIIIPAKAVLQEQDFSYVFVEIVPDKYVRRRIVTATAGENTLIVKSGLKEGENIVVEGGIYMMPGL